MRTRTFSLALTILTTGIFMTSSAQNDFDRTLRPKALKVPEVKLPQIQKATLSNGLQVLLVEDHELPVVAMNLVIQTGSAADPLDKPGIASMTADLLDEGTKNRTSLQIAEALEFIGADLSVRSGTDGSFITVNSMAKHLETAFDVFADVLLNPTFPQKEFDRLKEQRLTSLLQQKDRAPTIASLAFNKIVYGANHPYGNDPSGNEQSVKALTIDDLSNFYNKYYRPNNATLIVVGDIKLGALKDLIGKKLESWKSSASPAVAFPATPSIDKRRVYLVDKPGAAQSEVRIGSPAAARDTPDYFPLLIANRVLGGQFTSRLNLNLREKHGYTYGARSGIQFSKQPGPFVASAGVFTAKTDSSLIEFIYEIDKLHAEGATAEELEFIKKGLTGSFALSFETAAQIAGALQNIVLYGLPERYYETYLQKINDVSLDEVKRACAKYFDSSHMAVVVVGDMKTTKAGIENLKLGETVISDTEGKALTQ